MPHEVLTAGRRVRVRRISDADWSEGSVVLASGNGESVAIALVGGVRTADGGIIAGVLPLSIDYDAERVTGLDGTEYEVEVGGD